MTIKLSCQTLPDDPQSTVESERSRAARQKQLDSQVEHQIRAGGIASKRAARLDHYFSKRPPNGRLLDIFRESLPEFKNTNGENPRWLAFENLEACFARLHRAGILVVEVSEDSFGVKTIKSHATADALANRRNVRPAEIDSLVRQLKQDISDALQQPAIAFQPPIHGCRYVPAIDKWRVSLYFGGSQRALGCYPFETAIRLQDVLFFHFSTYRRLAHYNTSESHAVELMTKYPAIATFCAKLEKLWLDSGILLKPGTTPLDKDAEWHNNIEKRLSAIENHLKIST